MTQHRAAWAAPLAVLLLAPVLLLCLGVAVVGATDRCPSGGVADPVEATSATSAGVNVTGGLGLTTTQWQRASAIVATGQAMRMPDRGIVIALAVARQESGFRNYANDGRGGDLAVDQRNVARSLRVPHDAVGTDHGSVGVFQQQWPWWGTLTELMTPATAAGKFYQALRRVSGWQTLPLTVAAQRVQRSAYPNAYADDADTAHSILDQIAGHRARPASNAASGTGPFEGAGGNDSDCLETTTSRQGGSVTWPLPARLKDSDRGNWGGRGGRWSSWHTGTDFSVGCGTPVLAAHAGTARIDRTEPWAGTQLLRITRGPGRLTTWYAHMRRVDVADGEAVTAGEQVGQVGQEGNATGCHLHFEVHTRGGPIYGPDNTNPTTWLKRHVGRDLPGGSARSTSSRLSLVQYNVKNRAAAVEQALRSRPTLLGLNESHRLSQRWREQRRAPHGYTVVNAGAGSPGRRQNSLLVAPGLRVLRSRVVPLSDAVPGDRFGHDRWALVTELVVPGVGRHVHIQTHLNAGVRRLRASAPRAREYAESVQNLSKLLDQYGAAPSLTVAGDMNLDRDSRRFFAWAPVLARHGLTVRSEGVDVIAARGLLTRDTSRIPRGPSDHPAIGATLVPRR